MAPVTRYTSSGGASIAYQVTGDGRLDLVFMTGWISQVEHLWESTGLRRLLERLSVFGRLILFDRRGTGLSDGVGEPYTLEQEAQDALAVLDAAGSERAALFTYGLGGPVAAVLAAEHPERVCALIMYASIARALWAPDYDWAMTREERAEWIDRAVDSWGAADHPGIPVMAPTMADDPALISWFARMQRLAASPGNARELLTAAADLDVRELLPQIHVPTLVMHRNGDTAWDPRHSRYIAERIPGARYVELEGTDSLPFLGDSDARVGSPPGECELLGAAVGGMAVHSASRVSGLAGGSEVLVSGTVFGTVVGGPFSFEDRGFHELKGVPGRWPLFALRG